MTIFKKICQIRSREAAMAKSFIFLFLFFRSCLLQFLSSYRFLSLEVSRIVSSLSVVKDIKSKIYSKTHRIIIKISIRIYRGRLSREIFARRGTAQRGNDPLAPVLCALTPPSHLYAMALAPLDSKQTIFQ